MISPLASVLIPTFNRASYVADAVRSALAQSVEDIEVIVVDDGSSDDTAAVLANFTDRRLRIVRHTANLGIPVARNTALDTARGQYIAWLDSDDVARPTRLVEQIAFLQANLDIAMVGACAGKLHPDGTRSKDVRIPPLTPETIAAWLLFRSPFQQSAVTGRADVLRRYRYNPAFPVCEDLDMFLRLQRDHRLANLPRLLVDRRLHAGQAVRQRQREIMARKAEIYAPLLERLGLSPSTEDMTRHVLLGKARLDATMIDAQFLTWTRRWLRRLAEANKVSAMLSAPALAMTCAYVWLLACRAARPTLGWSATAHALASSRLPLGLLSSDGLAWLRQAIPIWCSGDR